MLSFLLIAYLTCSLHTLQVTLIDFTLSRLVTVTGEVAFCDLAADPELFKGPKGSVQACKWETACACLALSCAAGLPIQSCSRGPTAACRRVSLFSCSQRLPILAWVHGGQWWGVALISAERTTC